ncbi:MAG TPA: glycosyltransferase family 87 protein [Chthoniobacterales bacterium]|nr:glycosyltransferase family 87 protein [Chthoniobacterales bacterium]
MVTTRSAWLGINSGKALLLLLLAVVLLSRLPFLGAGYGLHWDAWGNAKMAREIADTGHYTMARRPGAPVYELTSALLSWGGPWALNGLSALGGVACVGIFALLARKYQCRDWLLAASAFAFSPVMYVSSVTAKDFTVACALLLLSTLLIVKNRPVAAGVSLGLAMGCRLTSGVMGLPLALMLLGRQPEGKRFKQLVWLAVTSAAVVLIAFIPAFLTYGFSFLTYFTAEGAPRLVYGVYYPSWKAVLHRGTVEVWGMAGSIGLVFAIVGALAVRRGRRSTNDAPARDLIAWGAAIVIYVVLYAAFPDQAGYFLPAVPFTILLLACLSPRWLFQAFCILTILGAFVDWKNGAPAAGAIFQDRAERLRTIENVRNFYSYARTIPGRNVFVIGAFYHGIGLIAPESKNGHFAYLLSEKELTDYLKGGFTIYYLPAMRQFEYDVHGIDLAKHGAIDLIAFRESQKARTEK